MFVPPGSTQEDDVVIPCEDVPVIIATVRHKGDCYYLGPWINRETCGCRRKHYRLCDHPDLFPITTVNACQSCDKWED